MSLRPIPTISFLHKCVHRVAKQHQVGLNGRQGLLVFSLEFLDLFDISENRVEVGLTPLTESLAESLVQDLFHFVEIVEDLSRDPQVGHVLVHVIFVLQHLGTAVRTNVLEHLPAHLLRHVPLERQDRVRPLHHGVRSGVLVDPIESIRKQRDQQVQDDHVRERDVGTAQEARHHGVRGLETFEIVIIDNRHSKELVKKIRDVLVAADRNRADPAEYHPERRGIGDVKHQEQEPPL